LRHKERQNLRGDVVAGTILTFDLSMGQVTINSNPRQMISEQLVLCSRVSLMEL
jgi:hypothetical protein